MNKIQGAIEGIHYHVINGRAFPIVRGGDGPLSPVEEAERDARYLADCLREIHETATARGAALTDAAERAAATALTDDEQARWDAGEAERLRLVSVIERHNAVAAAAAVADGGAADLPAIMVAGLISCEPGTSRGANRTPSLPTLHRAMPSCSAVTDISCPMLRVCSERPDHSAGARRMPSCWLG